jgi:hypothetical protein
MNAVPNRLQEDSTVFDVRFWRRTDASVHSAVFCDPNTRTKPSKPLAIAARRAPRFDHEGEFLRSWLL